MTALLGGLLGFLIAYAAIRDGTPRWIRGGLTTFSGVAANFAGIPLAFAFIATLGTIGIVTQFLDRAARLEPVRPRLHALLEDGDRAHLPLLPDPAHDPRHRARDRRACGASGARRPRASARARGSSGGTSASRSCSRRCSARGAALRQLVRGVRDRLRAHGAAASRSYRSDRLLPLRRRARRPARRAGARVRHVRRARA